MASQTFKTRLVSGESKNVTGIVVPDEVMAALGAGQRPRLKITVNGYEMTAVPGRMGGKDHDRFQRRAPGGVRIVGRR